MTSESIEQPQMDFDPACALLALLFRSCAGTARGEVDAEVALAMLEAAKARGFDGEAELNDRIAEILELAEKAVALLGAGDLSTIMAPIDARTLDPITAQLTPGVARPSFERLVAQATAFLSADEGLQKSDADIASAITFADANRDLSPRGRITAARIVAVLAARAREYDRASVILQRVSFGRLGED